MKQASRYWLFIVTLIIISCNDTAGDKPTAVSTSTEEAGILKIDTIDLPPILKDAHSVGSYYDETRGDVLLFHDIKTHFTTTFSIKNKTIFDTLEIPSKHVRSIIAFYRDVRQYMQWHTRDTLIFMDDMEGGERNQTLKAYSIPNDSIFLSIPLGDFSNPNLNELFGRASNYLLTNWKSQKAFISPFTDFSLFNTDPMRSMVLGKYNFQDSTVDVLENMSFPFLKKNHDYGFLTEYFMVYNPQENAYLTASSLSPVLHLYHLDEAGNVINSKIAKPLSKYYEKLPPPPGNVEGKMDYDKLEEIEITAYAGSKLFYNVHLNMYFRFFEKPQELEPEEGHFSSYQTKEFGLMILNNELQLVSELPLGKKSQQAPISARTISTGIAFTTNINEDHRELIIISPQ
jgi:hypothetical protein